VEIRIYAITPHKKLPTAFILILFATKISYETFSLLGLTLFSLHALLFSGRRAIMPKKKSTLKRGEVTPAIVSFLRSYFKRNKVFNWGRAHVPKELHRATINVVCSKLATAGYLKLVGRKQYSATPALGRASASKLVKAALAVPVSNRSPAHKVTNPITRKLMRLIRTEGGDKVVGALVEAMLASNLQGDNSERRIATLERENSQLQKRIARAHSI
jgi:hypothetical protein